jgi:hypothetical protein
MRYAVVLAAVLAGCAPMQPITVPPDAGVSFVIRHGYGGLHDGAQEAADKHCATLGLKAQRSYSAMGAGGGAGWGFGLIMYFVAPVPYSVFECVEAVQG